MSEKENKELTYEYLKDSNSLQGDPSKMDSFFNKFYSQNVIAHQTSGDVESSKYKQYLQGMFTAFPDAQFSMDDVIAEEDKVVFRSSWSGTHQGELQGIPPTGKKITVKTIVINRISDGKIIELWSIADSLGMMQQLGVIPPRG